jgi:hypothetical protein
MLAVLLVSGTDLLRGAVPSEIKAAFVLNFAKFTRWPEGIPDDRLRICFLTTAEAVGDELARMAGKKVQGKRIDVLRGIGLRQLDRCQIVYLGENDVHRQREVLAKLAGSPALVLSDLPGFISAGGMIELFPEGKKYRFSINREVVREAGLEINARLLGLARRPGERYENE